MHSWRIIVLAFVAAVALLCAVPAWAAPAKPAAPSSQTIAAGTRLCDQADALLKAGKAKEALALYEQALKLLPKSPRARAGVAAARKRLAATEKEPPRPAAEKPPAPAAKPDEPAPAQPAAAGPAEAPPPPKELSLDAAETSRSLHLAIVPFRHLSPHAENAWVGEAVAETLAAKLGDIPGVQLVERRRLQEVVQAGLPAQDADAAKAVETGKLLGAEALVLGSVQSTGAWDRPGTTVRLDARVVRVETGQVAGDTAVSVDGPFQDLLRLQRELAEKLLRALRVAPSEEEARLLAKEEAQSLEALRAFGEGRRLLGEKDYRGALALLQEAQRKNGGEFFAAAHRVEGEAYNGLVESAPEAEKAGLQKEYLEKFRRDAEEAAPAFYDLGVAYEANTMHAEAIQAYESFLKHAGQSARAIRWRRKAAGSHVPYAGAKPRAVAYPHWAVSGRMLLLWDGEAQIEGVDLESGSSLWRQMLPDALVRRGWHPELHGIPVPGNPRFMLCWGAAETKVLLLVNGLTGRPLWPGLVEYRSSAPGSSVPFAVAAGMCLWIDHQGVLTTCDAVTGAARWQGRVALGASGAGTGRDSWRVRADGGLAYVERTTTYGKSGQPALLVAGVLPLTGQLRWWLPLPTTRRGYGPAVIPCGERVAFVMPRDDVGAVDVSVCDGATGRALWQRRDDCVAAAASEALLILCGQNGIAALDAAEGRELLRVPVPDLPQKLGTIGALSWVTIAEREEAGSLLCRGRHVFLRDSKQELYIIDAMGGRVVRRLAGVTRVLPTWDGGLVARLKEDDLIAYNPPGRSARIQDREALVGIGRALLALGKAREASQALTQAVEAAPDAPAAWQWLAATQTMAGDEASAVSSWQRAVELLPSGSPAASFSQEQLRKLSGIAWMASGLGSIPSVCYSQGVLCVSFGLQGAWEGHAEAIGFGATDGRAPWRVRIPRRHGSAQDGFYLKRVTSYADGFCAISETAFGKRQLALPIHPLMGVVGEPVDAGQLRQVQQDAGVPAGTSAFAGRGWQQANLPGGLAGETTVWSPASFAVTASGDVCAITGTGHAFGLDPATGANRWVLPLREGRRAKGVWAFGGDLVYVLDDQGTLYAVDARYARERAAAGHKWWSDK